MEGLRKKGFEGGVGRVCYRMLMLRSPLLLSCALLAAFARAPAMPAVESFPLKTFQKRRVSSAAAERTNEAMSSENYYDVTFMAALEISTIDVL